MLRIMNSAKNYALPRIVDALMDNEAQHVLRAQVVGKARGNVLEIGIGSGLNLRHYRKGVQRITGIDPSPGFLRICAERIQETGLTVHLVQGRAEELPFPDHEFNTIVTTWTLCSINNIALALQEIRRTLKPCGELLFLEHGRSADNVIVRLQDAFTPLTKLSSGCRINRPIAELLQDAGFEITLRTRYAGILKPFVYMYEGCATPIAECHGLKKERRVGPIIPAA